CRFAPRCEIGWHVCAATSAACPTSGARRGAATPACARVNRGRKTMHARRRPVAQGGPGQLCRGAARRAAIRCRAGTLAIGLLLSLLAACAARKPATPAPAESGRTNVQTIAVFPFDNDAVTDRERL